MSSLMSNDETQAAALPLELVAGAIVVVRGQRVMLDADLAGLYGVTTGNLVQAVKRNPERFPPDFMFQLTAREFAALRLQGASSNVGRGGRRYLPYAFTEQGVAMLSSVLRSARAVQVNVEIMRAFVRLRGMATRNVSAIRRLDELEKRYDAQFRMVFDAIELLSQRRPPARRLGFRTSQGEAQG